MQFPESFFASFAILLHVTKVSADFHVGYWDSASSVIASRTEACPSNYYNCDCFQHGGRTGFGPGSDAVASGSDFSIGAGLCGLGQLDFYNRGGGHYQFYQHNGDGTLQGDCFNNVATSDCGSTVWEDRLVCFSYICN